MNILKWLFSNLQLVLVLALLVTIRAGYEVLKERTKRWLMQPAPSAHCNWLTS
uniref:hypothetical protein n=1 Tax=Aeromonas hydrophila TaxID=644 RepID=UPI000A4DEE2A|nr:hypothetical protein [Aeromonas hydrophila]